MLKLDIFTTGNRSVTRVKKADLVTPFHEFVGSNYLEYDSN